MKEEKVKVNYKTIKNIIGKTVKYNYCGLEFIGEIRTRFNWYLKKEITLKIDTRNGIKTRGDIRLFYNFKEKNDFLEFILLTN